MNLYKILKDERQLCDEAKMQNILPVENKLGFKLPIDLVDFLLKANGGLFKSGIAIYSIDDLIERNTTFEVLEYLPGFLLIGDDSGGKGILLSTDPKNKVVYLSGLGDLSVSGLKKESESFALWIQKIMEENAEQ